MLWFSTAFVCGLLLGGDFVRGVDFTCLRKVGSFFIPILAALCRLYAAGTDIKQFFRKGRYLYVVNGKSEGKFVEI